MNFQYYGFLLVPHSNYGSICYRLATIHFRDTQTERQTDRQTDGLDDSNSDPLLTVTVAKNRQQCYSCVNIQQLETMIITDVHASTNIIKLLYSRSKEFLENLEAKS